MPLNADLLDEAARQSREILERNPENPDNWFRYAEALLRAGKPMDVLTVLTQGRELGLSGPPVHQLTEAATIMQDAEATIRHADKLVQAGHFEEAALFYAQAIRYHPDLAALHNNLGGALFRLERFAEAIEVFREVVALAPDYANGHCNLGAAFMELGDHAAALEPLRRAIQIDPHHARALANLDAAVASAGKVLVADGRVDDAVDLLVEHEFHWTTVNIEVTTHCNLRCVNCPRTVEVDHDRWSNRHMTPDAFAKVIANIPPTDMCHLTWLGEPTLHPDLPQLVDIARQSGRFKEIRLTTNGLARSVGYYSDLVARGVNHILISADSFTPEVVVQTRPGTIIDKLLTRIRELRNLPTNVGISYTLSTLNIDDFENTLRELDRIGGLNLVVDFLSDFSDDGDVRIAGGDIARLRAQVEAAAARYPGVTIEIMTYPMVEFPVTHPEYCFSLFSAPAVTVDGMFSVCCLWRDEQFLGGLDLTRMTMAEAKRTPAFRSFLREFIQRRPDFCARCSQNVRKIPDA